MNSILVAYDDNFLIGAGDKLPWRIPEDLKLFKQATMGHPILMGRKTWDSLPKRPLPGRTNIVLSRSGMELDKQVVFIQDISEALAYPDLFVIGGRQVFTEALSKDMIDRIIVHHIFGKFEGDVYFPAEALADWTCLTTENFGKFERLEYQRVPQPSNQ